MYRVRGLKIKIPHNSTVRSDGSLSFAGTFNGTLKSTKEYCNDPAWVLYDLITESRAGFGDFVTEDEVCQDEIDADRAAYEAIGDICLDALLDIEPKGDA